MPGGCKFIFTGCLNIHGTYVIANNSANNNVVFLFLFQI